MKTLLVSAAAAAVLMVAVPGESLAQRAGNDGVGLSYDAQTIWTVSGEVISLERVVSDRVGYHGVRLLLKTGRGDLWVQLGPSWFVDHQAMRVALHDVIEVKGSPVVYDGKPTLLAAVVKKGSKTLELRTAKGVPLWGGSRAR